MCRDILLILNTTPCVTLWDIPYLELLQMGLKQNMYKINIEVIDIMCIL